MCFPPSELGRPWQHCKIQDFIDRVNADGRFKVVTNSMSTQVFGRYEDVFEVLAREIRGTFEKEEKAVFVMKVLGPLAPA